MAEILLVTSRRYPDGEPGGDLLVQAFAERGVSARWVCWDDDTVAWSQADAVALRSTWDYHERVGEFTAWLRRIEADGARLLASSKTIAWNLDKAYLVELAKRGVSVVPTIAVDGEEELPSAIAEFAHAVVKPRTSAGGLGVVLFDLADGGPDELDESNLGPGPWVVQPLVTSIATEGEYSVYVLGGKVVSAARKVPASGDIRVHEEYGGRSERFAVTDELAALAEHAISVAEQILGEGLRYGRVDAMRLASGELAVSELELIEPGLYLDVLAENAAAFVDAVLAQS